MTFRKVPSTSEMHETPYEVSQQQNRRITDKFGLRLYPLLAAVYFIFYLAYKIGPFNSANETWEEKTYSNSSSEAISNAILLINTTLRAVQDENLYENPCISIVIGLLKAVCLVGGVYFLIIRIALIKLLEISRKTFNMEYMHHYVVINVSRMIVSVICFTVMYSRWNNPPKALTFCSVFWGSTEFLNLVMISTSLVASRRVETRTPTFKDILRFYFLRRNLILFQFLNFAAMLTFVAGVALLVKIYFESSMLTYQLALVVSFSVAAIMHTCAKMTIMLATASYNWNKDEEGVSWKLMASSLEIIIRYHLGSVILYFPVLEFISYLDFPNRSLGCTKEELYMPHDSVFTMECSEMLIAIHAKCFRESKNTLGHSEMKSWINRKFKSITSMVWSDIIVFSSSLLVLCTMIQLTNSISTVEDLFSSVVYVMTCTFINGSFYYIIIKPVNVIENAIEFSEIMELGLSTGTNDSEGVPTEV